MDIPVEKLEKWYQSDLKLGLLRILFEAFNSGTWSMTESRPDLDIHAGHVGDTVIEITLTHPKHGEIKISGKNFI